MVYQAFGAVHCDVQRRVVIQQSCSSLADYFLRFRVTQHICVAHTHTGVSMKTLNKVASSVVHAGLATALLPASDGSPVCAVAPPQPPLPLQQADVGAAD